MFITGVLEKAQPALTAYSSPLLSQNMTKATVTLKACISSGKPMLLKTRAV